MAVGERVNATGRASAFGDLLRAYRLRAGLSQEQLAERAALSTEAVSALERGRRRRPFPKTVSELAGALSLSPTERMALADAAQGNPAPSPTIAPQQLPSVPSNLPSAVTTLVGRNEDEAALAASLRAPGVRLLTLTGPGGVGKTSLAIHVAGLVRGAFTDGVYFVSLAPVTKPNLVAATIARVVGDPASASATAESLTEFLRDRQILLLLDNFEHLVVAAPLVAVLLANCPELKVLATSRAPLRLNGEHEHFVFGLVAPRLGSEVTPAALLQFPAAQLFLERAQAIQPGFGLTEANAPFIARISARLDGLPLAIELAAARTRIMSLKALEARLVSPGEVLSGGPRDAPLRHQSLWTTIGWSYDLLDRPGQALFRRLSVFVDGFTLSAAAAVATGTAEPQPPSGSPTVAPDWETVEALEELVQHSLLQRADNAAGEPRLRMLETIRSFALDRLAEVGERPSTERAHAAYFLILAESAGPELVRSEQICWLERLDAELDNLRAALQWHVSNDPRTGLRLASSVWCYWRIRSLAAEGRRWIDEQFRAMGPLADVGDTEIAALAVRVFLSRDAGFSDQSRQQSEELIEVARPLEHRWGMAMALLNLGVIDYVQKNQPRARARLEEALPLFQFIGDGWGVGSTLSTLGRVANEAGDQTRAIELLERSLATHRALGDVRGTAAVLGYLGGVERIALNYARASELHQESLALFRQVGDLGFVGYALKDVALSLQGLGELASARALMEEGLECFRQIRHKSGMSRTLHALSALARLAGDPRRRQTWLAESLDHAQQSSDTSGLGWTHVLLAAGAQDRGDNLLARRHIAEAFRIFESIPDQSSQVQCLELSGAFAVRRNNFRVGVQLFAAAVALRHGMVTPLPPDLRADCETALLEARTALGENAFDRAWDVGQQTSLTAAIAQARELE